MGSKRSGDRGVDALLQDTRLMEEIIASILKDDDLMKSLVEEIADEIADVIEESPEFRLRFLQAVRRHAGFRKKLAEEIAKELD